MRKVTAPQVATPDDVAEHALSPRVQEAPGELVGQAKEGLLALSVGDGLGGPCRAPAATADYGNITRTEERDERHRRVA